jgi:hypothetical protein
MRRQQTAFNDRDGQKGQGDSPKLTAHASVWVLMGFVLWIGFFIGAIILHAMAK